MSLLLGFGLLLTTVLAGAIAIIGYRTFRRSDFIIISLPGRSLTNRNPLPVTEKSDYTILDAPFIRPVNDFLIEFTKSAEKTIQITPDDTTMSSDAAPLRALHGLDYEKIRLRLRAMSSLNPVVNLKAEEGVIRFSCVLSPNTTRNFEIRTIFAPKGQSILLEKVHDPDDALKHNG